MSTADPTGSLRAIKRGNGPVFYAQSAPLTAATSRKLGPAHLARSRPPRGHLTRAMAEGKLADMMAGENPTVVVAPASGATFTHAAREWLRYIEHDRKREHSTVRVPHRCEVSVTAQVRRPAARGGDSRHGRCLACRVTDAMG